MKMRKMPELKFIADNSIEHGADIARIIDDFEYINDNEADGEMNNEN